MVHVKSLKSVSTFSHQVAIKRAAGDDLAKFTAKWNWQNLDDDAEQLLVKELYESFEIPEKVPFLTLYCDQFGLFDKRQVYCPYVALNGKQQLCLFVGFHVIPIVIKDDGSILLNGLENHELDVVRETRKDRFSSQEYTVLSFIWYTQTYSNHEGDEPLNANDHTLVFPVWLTDTAVAETFATLLGKKNKGKEVNKVISTAVKPASTGAQGWVNLNRLFLPIFKSGKFSPTDVNFSGWELKPRTNYTSIEVYPDLSQVIAKYGDYMVEGIYGQCKVSEITRLTLSSSNKGSGDFLDSPVQPGVLTVYAPNELNVEYIPKFGVILASHQAQAQIASGGKKPNALKPAFAGTVPSSSPQNATVPNFDIPSAEDILG